MPVQKTLYAQAGHVGEQVHEARDSHLSDGSLMYLADSEITLEAGLGIELNADMSVRAVSEKGQAWGANPSISKGDVLVGYNTTEYHFKNSAEVGAKVTEHGGQINLHFNSMPKIKEAPKYVAPAPKKRSTLPLVVAGLLVTTAAVGIGVCSSGLCKANSTKTKTKPTLRPTRKPTRKPTKKPTKYPTAKPTECVNEIVLEESNGAYPGYAGPLKVTGTINFKFDADSVRVGYNLAGLDKACSQVGAMANSCGIHIHAGTSCDTNGDVGGHYFGGTITDDPWKNVVYETTSGFDLAKGDQTVVTGLTAAQTVGHVFVVHDHEGKRVKCSYIPAKCV